MNYEEDIYRDNTLVFYIENKLTTLNVKFLILIDLNKLEEIKQYFEANYGVANLHQVFSDRLEYFLIFQQYDAGSKLKALLDSLCGEHTCIKHFIL